MRTRGVASSPLARTLAAFLLGAVVLLLWAGPAAAVTVPSEPPELPTNPLPTDPEPDEEPTAEPSPDPSPQPDPAPSPTPTTSSEPASTPAPSATTPPSPVPPVDAGGSSGDTVLPGGSGPTTSDPVEAPQVAPPVTGVVAPSGRALLVTTPDGLSGALGGAFVLAFAAALGAVATSYTTFTMTNRGALVARTSTGEIDMERTRRTRTILGVALLGVAALIGLVGYLRISVETLVPVQVVYLASAGFGVVVFAIAGGSLLVAETLRSDERRVKELEAAVTTLATHMAGAVEDPPRLVERGGEAEAAPPPAPPADAVDTDAGAAADTAVVAPAPPEEDSGAVRRVRRVRRSGD